MNPYYAAPPPPPPMQQQPQRPGVDLDDLFGGPATYRAPLPTTNPSAPLPPSYDAVNGGYSSLPASAPPPPLPPSSSPQVSWETPQPQQYGSHITQGPGQSAYSLAPAAPLHSVTYATVPPPPPAALPHQPSCSPPGVLSGAYTGYPTNAPATGTAPAHTPYATQAVPPQAPAASVSVPVTAGGVAAAAAAPSHTTEEDDRVQLERIIRLRRELELEQEREQQKKEALQTWECAVCTFRSKLNVVTCEMCGTTRPGYTAPATDQPSTPSPSAAAAPPRGNAGVTAWQCGMCLAPNAAEAARCKVCHAYRSSGTPVPSTAPTNSSPSATARASVSGHLGVGSSTPFNTDWKCSICGEVNAPSRANCSVCNGYQRNGTPVTDGKVGAVQHRQKAPGGDTADPPPPTVWSCSVCTFENPVSVAVCGACESGQRPRHLAPPPPPRKEKLAATSPSSTHSNRTHPHHHHQHAGSDNGASGNGGKDGERASKTSSPAPTQWPCETCTFLNPIGRKKCDMCGARRPEAYAAGAETKEGQAAARQEAEDDAEEVAWQDDKSVTECNNCHTTFTFLIRRHHCRLCGFVFCAHCSNYSAPITMNSLPQRVCVNCYKKRLEEEKKTKKARRWLDE